jgi:hypothetical protein
MASTPGFCPLRSLGIGSDRRSASHFPESYCSSWKKKSPCSICAEAMPHALGSPSRRDFRGQKQIRGGGPMNLRICQTSWDLKEENKARHHLWPLGSSATRRWLSKRKYGNLATYHAYYTRYEEWLVPLVVHRSGRSRLLACHETWSSDLFYGTWFCRRDNRPFAQGTLMWSRGENWNGNRSPTPISIYTRFSDAITSYTLDFG